MLEFKDDNDRRVTLEFKENTSVKHILAICRYGDKYLMTDHKIRGVEFPGGKVEEGESVEEAVHRELFEETGASVLDMKYIGFYTVHDDAAPFSKGVYFVRADDLFFKCEYMETLGPVLFDSADDVPEMDRSVLIEDECIRYLYEKSKVDNFFAEK